MVWGSDQIGESLPKARRGIEWKAAAHQRAGEPGREVSG